MLVLQSSIRVTKPKPNAIRKSKTKTKSRTRRMVCNNLSVDQADKITRIVMDTSRYFCLAVGVYSGLQWNMYRNIRKKGEKDKKDK
jgi:hypothetical protein